MQYTGPEAPGATFEPRKPTWKLSWGGTSAQGRRPSMEDEHSADIRAHVAYLAVYDGHAGPRCSEHLSATTHLAFFDALPGSGSFAFREIAAALRAAFDASERSWRALAQSPVTGAPRAHDGSCAVAVAVDLAGGTVTAANTGDSRAALLRVRDAADEVVDLTIDHKPDHPREKARIEAAGGWVTHKAGGVPRVGSPGRSGLAISRAFGDVGFKIPREVVTHSPEIRAELLGSGERKDVLIVACDGVWDVMSNEQALRLAAEDQYAGDPEAASAAVVRKAYDLGSTDNLSVIVAFLEKLPAGSARL